MSEQQDNFPKSAGGHPRMISTWLAQMQDWVDGWTDGGPVRYHPNAEYTRPPEQEILAVTKLEYERMCRESRAYYAMRTEIGRMRDILLIEWGITPKRPGRKRQ